MKNILYLDSFIFWSVCFPLTAGFLKPLYGCVQLSILMV